MARKLRLILSVIIILISIVLDFPLVMAIAVGILIFLFDDWRRLGIALGIVLGIVLPALWVAGKLTLSMLLVISLVFVIAIEVGIVWLLAGIIVRVGRRVITGFR